MTLQQARPQGPATRRFAPTRAGVAVATAAMVLGLAALGFGKPLAVLACLALAALCASGWIVLRALGGLEVDVWLPARAFAATPFPVRLRVAGHVAARDVVVTLAAGSQGPLDATWLGAVGSGSVEVECRHRVPARGRCTELLVVLRSTFPFGLFEAVREQRFAMDLLVRPRIGALRRIEPRVVARRSGGERARRSSRGAEEEFRSLREWRAGEPRRRVCWKASARRDRVMLKDFEDPRREAVHVVLDNYLAPGSGGFELAVRLAASLASHYLRRGHPVRLTVPGDPTVSVQATHGRTALDPLLDALALVRPAPAPAPPFRGDAAERRVVVRCGRGGRSAPGSGAAVLDVNDPATRAWLIGECGWGAGGGGA